MTCFSWSTNLAVKGIQISWTNGSSSSKIKWLRSWNTKTFLKTKFKGLNTIFRLALHISLKHEKPQWESTLQWYYTYSWPWWDCKAWQDMAMVSNVSNLILGFLEERRCLLLSMICNTEGEKIKYTVLHATKANVFLAPPPFFFYFWNSVISYQNEHKWRIPKTWPYFQLEYHVKKIVVQLLLSLHFIKNVNFEGSLMNWNPGPHSINPNYYKTCLWNTISLQCGQVQLLQIWPDLYDLDLSPQWWSLYIYIECSKVVTKVKVAADKEPDRPKSHVSKSSISTTEELTCINRIKCMWTITFWSQTA